MKAQGIEARIAHGALRTDEAQQLFEQLLSAPDALRQQAASLPRNIAAEAPTAPDPALEKRMAERSARLREAIEAQYGWLASRVKRDAFPAAGDPQPILAALQDHYWVTATLDGQDSALDSSFRLAQPGQSFAPADTTVDPDALPDDLHSTVTFQLAAEYLAGGALTPIERLNVTAHSSDLVGKDIRFTLAPVGKGATTNRFMPTLAIADTVADGDPVQLRQIAGDDDQASASGLGGGLGGMFGGAPAGAESKAAAAQEIPASAPALARLTLSMRWHSPRRADETYRRVIVDRLAGGAPLRLMPAFADDAAIRPLLVQIWDGAVSVGPPAQPFVIQAERASLVAASAGARAFEAAAAAHQPVDPNALPPRQLSMALVTTMLASDYERIGLAGAQATGCRSYYTGPRLALMHHGIEAIDLTGSTAEVSYREGIDIVNAPFAFACRRGVDVVSLALRAGAADTAIELFSRPGISLNTIAMLSRPSVAAAPVFVARAAANLPDAVSAVPALARVLGESFARGDLVVGPSSLVADANARGFAWWEISPNGYPIGRVNLGAGQAMTENILTREQQEEVVKIAVNVMGNFVKCLIKSVYL